MSRSLFSFILLLLYCFFWYCFFLCCFYILFSVFRVFFAQLSAPAVLSILSRFIIHWGQYMENPEQNAVELSDSVLKPPGVRVHRPAAP